VSWNRPSSSSHYHNIFARKIKPIDMPVMGRGENPVEKTGVKKYGGTQTVGVRSEKSLPGQGDD
jgi:hypothetical protein